MEYLLQDPWFHLKIQGNWVPILWEQNCTLHKEWLRLLNVINQTNTVSSTVTGKTYKINHKFDFDENCLVYLLKCKHCGIQYVGQPVADFCYRWNNYRHNCRKHSRDEDCMQKHLYDHYLSGSNDFLNMVSVTFIDKTDPSNPHEREQYWRYLLQTNAPHGLNIADGV